MHHARELVTAAETVTGEMQAEIQALQEGERKDSAKLWAENWYDGLTYCKQDLRAISWWVKLISQALGMHSGSD